MTSAFSICETFHQLGGPRAPETMMLTAYSEDIAEDFFNEGRQKRLWLSKPFFFLNSEGKRQCRKAQDFEALLWKKLHFPSNILQKHRSECT